MATRSPSGRTPSGRPPSLERVDPADAGAYVAYDRHVRALSGFLARMNRTTPARLDKATPRDLVEGLKLGKAYRGLGARTARELTRALPMAVADFVREWFRDDAICGALAARGTLMTELGPWSAGSALVLLNDMAEGDGGAAGETALVRGGPQVLGDALAAAARAAGAEVRTGSGGRATDRRGGTDHRRRRWPAASGSTRPRSPPRSTRRQRCARCSTPWPQGRGRAGAPRTSGPAGTRRWSSWN